MVISKEKSRILFLDDRSKRFKEAMKRWKDDDLTIVCTSKECIKLISTEEFDVISLDHDLGFEEFVPSIMPNTGMEVIRHICENIDFLRDKLAPASGSNNFIIHTSNEPAGYKMVERLREVGLLAWYNRFRYD